MPVLAGIPSSMTRTPGIPVEQRFPLSSLSSCDDQILVKCPRISILCCICRSRCSTWTERRPCVLLKKSTVESAYPNCLRTNQSGKTSCCGATRAASRPHLRSFPCLFCPTHVSTMTSPTPETPSKDSIPTAANLTKSRSTYLW